MNDLITIETLPVIKYHLEQLSIEIKEKVDRANNLVCNDETVKTVKQVRADLNKEFNELETQRKQVKSAIMAKYDEFEEIYKENVSNLYKEADATLKEKIDNVENELKLEKEEELREFANQHIEANKLKDLIQYENIGLNITLSASMKSLKEQIIKYIEDVLNDLKLIELEEFKDEILVEYKNNKDFTKSKIDVITRHKQLEELQQKQKEIQLQIDEENKIVEKVEEIIAPKEIIEDEEIIEVSFTVRGKVSKIKELKKWLKESELEYE